MKVQQTMVYGCTSLSSIKTQELVEIFDALSLISAQMLVSILKQERSRLNKARTDRDCDKPLA